MKVLIVCSYRSFMADGIAPFISEQVNSMKSVGLEFDYYLIKAKGIKGYLCKFPDFTRKVKSSKPDIIHAHYGLCGLFANLQRRIPVITTYHGSDINIKSSLRFSHLSIKLSKWNIFVSQKLVNVSNVKKNFSIIPCGVDTTIFYPRNKEECRKLLNLDKDKIYILFSNAFHIKVKNYPLAKAAVELIPNTELIELSGYTRTEVALLMNACDVGLLTSFSEGSPQFVKEALASNCPVVCTDVGDVSEIIDGLVSCVICKYDVRDVVLNIKKVLAVSKQKILLRDRIFQKYDLAFVAHSIIDIYNHFNFK